MSIISFKLDESLKKVIQDRADLEKKSIDDYLVSLIEARLEDEYDYAIAMKSYESVDLNDTTTLEDLCKEVGINYHEL